MKVLVVDDSIVFRTQISSALKGVEGIEVVGTAANGKIAVQKLEQMQVDLMTLDMEMPELNGIETLKLMREKGFKTRVIVFSSQTRKGAEKALEALSAGANDIVLKPQGEDVNFDSAQAMIKEALVPKVLQFLEKKERQLPKPSFNFNTPSDVKPSLPKRAITPAGIDLVVIASSTGGPSALEGSFSGLKGPFKLPVLIVQHMPPVFTQILAKRLADLTGAPFKEAENGEMITNQTALIAPGDFHMEVKETDKKRMISLNQKEMRNSVRPAADNLFETASQIYGKNILCIVLTGMGEDGAAGAKVIRSQGGKVLIQNKESCVVFGMPGAVYSNDDYDVIGDLKQINEYLRMVLL